MFLPRLTDQASDHPHWATVAKAGERIIVTCDHCELVDAEPIHQLHRLLVGIREPSTRIIELDLRRVRGTDTKLAAALVLAVRDARNCGVTLVVQAPRHVQHVIEVCRLDGIIRSS